MKLGVMADSHDNIPRVNQAVDLFNAHGVDLVIHAGDFVSPFAVVPLSRLNSRVIAVFGNNDGERVGLAAKFAEIEGEVHPNLAEVELGGRRISAMHYPELALPIAAGPAYDLVIYGHTHKIDVRRQNTLLLNPGETGGWLTGRCTVAIVDLTEMEVEIVDLPA